MEPQRPGHRRQHGQRENEHSERRRQYGPGRGLAVDGQAVGQDRRGLPGHHREGPRAADGVHHRPRQCADPGSAKDSCLRGQDHARSPE
ncbi:MAG: hypothetical protein MZU97_07740 [Bacillus subtilis]|nr:hypothetical protein [Bacillus subtilis]